MFDVKIQNDFSKREQIALKILQAGITGRSGVSLDTYRDDLIYIQQCFAIADNFLKLQGNKMNEINLGQPTIDKIKKVLIKAMKQQRTEKPEITRRDFFAGCALMGGLSSYARQVFWEPEHICESAFEIADLMENARNKLTKTQDRNEMNRRNNAKTHTEGTGKEQEENQSSEETDS